MPIRSATCGSWTDGRRPWAVCRQHPEAQVPASLRAVAQLRRQRTLRHGGEIALYAFRADDERMVFADLPLQRHQPGLRVSAVVLAVIREDDRRACVRGCFGNLPL